MNKLIIAAAVTMGFFSSAWAAGTVDAHNQVNNAQALAHQVQSSTQKSAVEGSSAKMMDMDQHQRAAIAHEMVKNGRSGAHKEMAEKHRRMMQSN